MLYLRNQLLLFSIIICLSIACKTKQLSSATKLPTQERKTTFTPIGQEITITGKIAYQPSAKTVDCYCAGNEHFTLTIGEEKKILQLTEKQFITMEKWVGQQITVIGQEFRKKIPHPTNNMVAHPINDALDENGELIARDYFECTILRAKQIQLSD